MFKSQESRDLYAARKLYQQENCLGITENAILPKNKDKENYKPRTLIDQTLELIDPTPNIFTLFVQFNERFFWNVLLPVEVKWSNRMTSCAGVCTFHPRNRQCVISLSAPLLKLRPRKDLIETLLHEMIHGYLFLTNNNRDRDGHGPEFCKHMDRINREAGTKITIYHSFHDEVKLYQQHWWRCDGPCQKRAPYFGMVRRAMNRAPGPSDFWWKEHEQSCGGKYIKIKEPEGFKAKGSKTKDKVSSTPKSVSSNTPKSPANNMFNWLTKTSTSKTTGSSLTPKNVQPALTAHQSRTVTKNPTSTFTTKSIKPPSSIPDSFKKLGNNTNNVHGWGTGGPNGSNSSTKSTPTPGNSRFSCSGTLGGSNAGRSSLLDKFDNKKHESNVKKIPAIRSIGGVLEKPIKPTNQNQTKIKDAKIVECSICDSFISEDDLHTHSCSTRNSFNKTESPSSVHKKKVTESDKDMFPNKRPKLNDTETVNCPVCNKNFALQSINEHLDKCLSEGDSNNKNDSIICINDDDSSCSTPKIQIDQLPESNKSHKCLVCNNNISPNISLNDHLEDCIGSMFNDDTINFDEEEVKTFVDESDKFPCPVCMKLVSESCMNEHLDICIKNT